MIPAKTHNSDNIVCVMGVVWLVMMHWQIGNIENVKL